MCSSNLHADFTAAFIQSMDSKFGSTCRGDPEPAELPTGVRSTEPIVLSGDSGGEDAGVVAFERNRK